MGVCYYWDLHRPREFDFSYSVGVHNYCKLQVQNQVPMKSEINIAWGATIGRLVRSVLPF